MRLLMVDDNPRLRALLRHHLSCDIPHLDIVVHDPTARGSLHPHFLAQGFGAVLLATEAAPTGDTLGGLRDLTSRRGFAPVIFLVPGRDVALMAAAREAGAFAVVATDKIDHADLIAQVQAAQKFQDAQQADWRGAIDAREQQTFGGAFVKGYRRVHKIASGSVSDLFLAESAQAGTLVVLKVSRDTRRTDGIDQSFERFIQEYEIVRSIRHPNVVHVLDLGVTDNYAYLVMEYFPRGDLRKRMSEGLSARAALDCAVAIADALRAIHGAGILHRDLKPGNVLLRDDGSLALIDFGLAKHPALALEITDKGLIFGTPHYMSPEQGHGKPIDARSDLYALGVISFEMLTGRKPYDADNPMAVIYKHAKEPIPRLPEALVSLQTVIDRLLAKDPQDRYPDATVARHALIEARASLPRSELAA